MGNLTKENIQKIAEYVWLSSEVCSDLTEERDALLADKEALEKQAQEAKPATPYSDEEVDNLVKKMHSAGFIKSAEQDEARQDIRKNPRVLMHLVEQLADRETGSGVMKLGSVEADTSVHSKSSSERESDKVWNNNFLNS